MAWAGLAGDVIDLAVPFVSGVGETIKAVGIASDAGKVISKADDVADAGKTAQKVTEAIEDTGDTKKFLQKAANQVKSETTGHVSGTKQHAEFKNIIDNSNNSNLRTEVSFKDGEKVDYGTKGSVRFDVVEYDKNGNVVAAYDLKTGSASLSPKRIAEMRKHIGEDIPIFEIRPE